MTDPLSKERLAEIEARYEGTRTNQFLLVGVLLIIRQDLPDCIAEIKRLRTALRELYNDCRNEPHDEQRGKAMQKASEILEPK